MTAECKIGSVNYLCRLVRVSATNEYEDQSGMENVGAPNWSTFHRASFKILGYDCPRLVDIWDFMFGEDMLGRSQWPRGLSHEMSLPA
jgi:hypothetical protein